MIEIRPKSCSDCPLSERRGLKYFCRQYQQWGDANPNRRPDFCHVVRITLEEDKDMEC